MSITGFTSHKLDVVTTYSKTNLFQVGLNGVTNIEYDPITTTGITKISYTIGVIDYVTTYQPKINNKIDSPSHPTTFSTSISGADFEPYIIFPNNQNTFDIKEEAKMGLVFPPKVTNELFIERMDIAVFERHSRLSEIQTLDQLVDYRNGYYNIIENR